MYKIYQPMKYSIAKTQDELKSALADPRFGIQCKKDGASYVLAKDLDGTAHLYGDKISKKTGQIIDKVDNVPHIKKFIENFFPNGSQIIAEITCFFDWTMGCWKEHSNSKYVNSIMLATPEKAARRQIETKPCSAYMFDILYWDNEEWFNKDCIDRYNKLRELFESRWENTISLEWLSCTEMITENKDEVIAKWLAEGEEGGVLKLLRSEGRWSAKHAVSEIGETAKRPAHTSYKIKSVDTVDVVIVDVEYPKKEYTGKDAENAQYKDADGNAVNRLYALGMINAFKIGVYDEAGDLCPIGTVASGLDDELRLDVAHNPDNYIGSVIECACMSIDKERGTLRHPRFIRMRPDKDKSECGMEDIFG